MVFSNILKAGYTKEELDGSDAAVYVGSFVKGGCSIFGSTILQKPYNWKITNRFAYVIRIGSLSMLPLEMELPLWPIEYLISLTCTAQV